MILSREGRTYNDDWDCVWEAKAHRHDKGWSAEVAIPFDQLRFKEEENAVWGINLARFIARKNEETALMIGPKSATSSSRYRTTDIAELRGLRSLKTKRETQNLTATNAIARIFHWIRISMNTLKKKSNHLFLTPGLIMKRPGLGMRSTSTNTSTSTKN